MRSRSAYADALRADGVELTVDQRLFDDRRRRKTPAELEGIRLASRAAEAAMAAIAALLAGSEPGDGGRVVDGEPLTSELLRAAAEAAFAAHGCRGDDMIVAHGAAGGRRPRPRRRPDRERRRRRLRPLSRDTSRARCFSDMTRTFSSAARPELVEWHAHCVRGARALARARSRRARTGAELHRAVCRFFEERGQPTALSAPEGTVLREGFNHGLGHGVGLDVHEAPALGEEPVTTSSRAT